MFKTQSIDPGVLGFAETAEIDANKSAAITAVLNIKNHFFIFSSHLCLVYAVKLLCAPREFMQETPGC
jgi:hypothetical protein